MAFVSISNACAVELRFTYQGQRAALTFGFSKSSAYTVTDLQNIVGKMETWWNSFARSNQSSQVVMREVYARDMSSETGPSYTSSTLAGVTGSGSIGTAMPANVAFCISFRTGGRGRANRGRNYWFGFGSNQITGTNNVTAAYRNAIIALYSRLLAGGTSDPTPHVWSVLSRQLDGVPTGRAVPIIAVVAADDILDSMRRRLPGRGL